MKNSRGRWALEGLTSTCSSLKGGIVASARQLKEFPGRHARVYEALVALDFRLSFRGTLRAPRALSRDRSGGDNEDQIDNSLRRWMKTTVSRYRTEYGAYEFSTEKRN